MSGIPTMRSSASPCVGGSPLQPAFYRFTTRSALRLRLRPLRTPRHRDALGISYRTSTTKAREGLTPPCPTRLPGVRRDDARTANRPGVDQRVISVCSTAQRWRRRPRPPRSPRLRSPPPPRLPRPPRPGPRPSVGAASAPSTGAATSMVFSSAMLRTPARLHGPHRPAP